ncbi:MAG: SUMF1/EgtB/PvdO family nonheme iron enzyme [Lewinellaceae bacterium]|nr:SUMF1/EgtB/PvdO family nonheme iron enzyme [Lewinellaceae bacterium]
MAIKRYTPFPAVRLRLTGTPMVTACRQRRSGSLRARERKKKGRGLQWRSTLASYASIILKRAAKNEYTAPVTGIFEPIRRQWVACTPNSLSGNVWEWCWEWCWDWYDSGYYEKSKNSRDPRGPDSGSRRVNRGGSWFGTPAFARCANRDRDTPDRRLNLLGFRLARAVR